MQATDSRMDVVQHIMLFPKVRLRENVLRIITIINSDMMLMSKHCSSIYFRYKTTVLVFTLSVSGTVMLFLTDLTSASDDKSIGIEYCQKNK